MPEAAESPTPSIFSRIIAHKIPATFVAETDTLVAFNDIHPQAPVHVLIVPRTERYKNVVELAAGDPGLLQQMVALAAEIAASHGNGQFRLVFNTGEDAGQTVMHVHAHVLIGKLAEGTLA